MNSVPPSSPPKLRRRRTTGIRPVILAPPTYHSTLLDNFEPKKASGDEMQILESPPQRKEILKRGVMQV